MFQKIHQTNNSKKHLSSLFFFKFSVERKKKGKKEVKNPLDPAQRDFHDDNVTGKKWKMKPGIKNKSQPGGENRNKYPAVDARFPVDLAAGSVSGGNKYNHVITIDNAK